MNNNFAFNLKHIRQEKGLTQEQLGKLMNKDYSTIGKWENGSRSPIMEDVLKLSDILNVDIKDLIDKNYDFDKSKFNSSTFEYTDEETGLTVKLIPTSNIKWDDLSDAEKENYINQAMDTLYEYKRGLKDKKE